MELIRQHFCHLKVGLGKAGFQVRSLGYWQDSSSHRLLARGTQSSSLLGLSAGQLQYGNWLLQNKGVKPGSETKSMVFCNLISVTSYHFCHILFLRSKLLALSHTRRKGKAQKCECQEMGPLRAFQKLPSVLLTTRTEVPDHYCLSLW